MTKTTNLWPIIVLALAGLGCGFSTNVLGGVSQEAPSTALTQPQVMLTGVQPVTTLSGSGNAQVVPVMLVDEINAVSRGQMPVGGIGVSPSPSINSIQVPLNGSVQLDTYHLDRTDVEKIEIFINDMPAVSSSNTFPTSHVEVRVCTEYRWLRTSLSSYSQMCSQEGLQPLNVIEPAPSLRTIKERVSLIVTGKVPGAYQLNLTTTSTTGQNTITHRLIVMAPSR